MAIRPKPIVKPRRVVKGTHAGPAAGKPTSSFLKISDGFTKPYGGSLAPGAGNAALSQRQSQTPPDEFFAPEIAGYNKQLSGGLGDLATQENSTAGDFGFKLNRAGDQTLPDGTVVPGAVTGFQLDVSNPFSKASLLQKSFESAQRGTNAGFAARGHLYSGGRISAQNRNDFNNEQGNDALRRAFQDFIANTGSRRRGLSDNYDQNVLNAKRGLRDRQTAVPGA